MECCEFLRSAILKRGYHASWMLNGKIYLHGGVVKHDGNEQPLNDIVEVDVDSHNARELNCKNSGPKRSHHKCTVLDSKWACVVGGWDGKQRTADVWAFNMDDMEWITLKQDISSDTPAGLSSHTCTKISSNEVIVSGREGGVRMQRRYGSVFRLTIDIDRRRYHYKELAIHIASRSGHIACFISKETRAKSNSKLALHIHGGRDSDSTEVLGSFPRSKIDYIVNADELESRLLSLFPLSQPSEYSKLSKVLLPTKSRSLRHHAIVECGKYCMIHGGEMFGKARDTVSGEFYVVELHSNKWWSFSNLSCKPSNDLLKRMGHSMFYLNGFVYIVSGIGSDGKSAEGSVMRLSF